MSDTRKLIDFAHDQNGSEFRDALYSAIHDKVTAHIDAKRAEIAQTLVTQQEEEVEYDEDVEELDELSKSTLASYTGKAYKDQGVRMAKAGYISGLYKAGADKNINAKQLRKVVGKDETRKDKNRDAGVNRALGRLSKEEVEELDEELYYQHAKKLMDQGRDSHKPGPGAPYGRTFDGDAYHNPPGKSRLHVMDNGKKVKTVHVPDEHIERMDTKGKLEWPDHMDPTIEKHHFDAYAKTNAKHISDPVKESVGSMYEAGSPFDKDYKSQVPTKPGEKAGFTSKKVSTGTVYSRIPPKVEPTKEK